MRKIPLTRGLFAIVDDEDFEDIAIYNWFANKGYDTFYAARWTSNKGKRILVTMHGQIMKTPIGKMIDHCDRDGLNNRKENLEFTNKSRNALNSLRSINATGIYYDKNRNRFKAFLLSPKVYVGTFKTYAEAKEARTKRGLNANNSNG